MGGSRGGAISLLARNRPSPGPAGLNGTSLNGTSLNGTSLNGTSLNGTSLNGTRKPRLGAGAFFRSERSL
ncbi:MAG: pentapeptide repeat-containing protein [Candidatus Eisenbacteria bacterium]|nr:pentapeptide repeat-containing protein [Candidatus Eisenbacteria bacterium]